ncbi:DUF262 domain-containing protein [Pyruvatibacter sp.]|uniref:DUF262 domain-containing protein n=1 Tax=Pyruvatibacter sp. TaxID=1981328 RepID=UPI0032ED7B31
MPRSISQQDVSWFLDLHEKNQLDLDPPYQRRSVWTLSDKRFFIDTILNDYPAPPIFLHKSLDEGGRPTYHVVDGKQRLTTIIDFVAGKIRIPDDFGDTSLQKKRWKDLQRETREAFWNYVLIVEMLPSVDEASVRDTFERINRNSRKLERQEIRHAKFDGWLINSVETEANRDEWKEFGIVTTARAKRMSDVQFISELYAVVLKRKLNGFDQDWLDNLYAEYEDPQEDPLFIEQNFAEVFEKTKKVVGEVLEHCPDIKNHTKVLVHFYTLWGFLVLHTDKKFDPKVFADKYITFMNNVTEEIKAAASDNPSPTVDEAIRIYAANSRGASTDHTPRAARLSQLVTAMAGIQGVNHEGS